MWIVEAEVPEPTAAKSKSDPPSRTCNSPLPSRWQLLRQDLDFLGAGVCGRRRSLLDHHAIDVRLRAAANDSPSLEIRLARP